MQEDDDRLNVQLPPHAQKKVHGDRIDGECIACLVCARDDAAGVIALRVRALITAAHLAHSQSLSHGKRGKVRRGKVLDNRLHSSGICKCAVGSGKSNGARRR